MDRVNAGSPASEVAGSLGVSRAAVYNWLARYRTGGLDALRDRKSSGRPRKVDGVRLRQLLMTLVAGGPDDYGLTDAVLWFRRPLETLLAERFGVNLSGSSIDRLLARIGVARPAQIRGSCPMAAEHQGHSECVRIRQRATSERAMLTFLAEATLRWGSDETVAGGTASSPPTTTTLSGVGNRTPTRFAIYMGESSAENRLDFCRRLVQEFGQDRAYLVPLEDRDGWARAVAFDQRVRGNLTIVEMPFQEQASEIGKDVVASLPCYQVQGPPASFVR